MARPKPKLTRAVTHKSRVKKRKNDLVRKKPDLVQAKTTAILAQRLAETHLLCLLENLCKLQRGEDPGDSRWAAVNAADELAHILAETSAVPFVSLVAYEGLASTHEAYAIRGKL